MLASHQASMPSMHLSSYNELDFDSETALISSASPRLKSPQFMPTACARSHSSSLSTVSDDYSQSDDISFQGDEEMPHQYFYTPSTEASYYPSSAASTAEMNQYAYAPDYSNFEQASWEPSTVYPQHHGLPAFSDLHQALSSYPPFEGTPLLSNANIIPPTPQSPAPTMFDFNSMPQTLLGYLEASPGMSRPRSVARSQPSSVRSLSRSTSPASNLSSSPSGASLQAYGVPVSQPQSPSVPQTWRCAFPGCTSRALFTRGCDLRKHYNRHSKHLFCRVEGCPQSAPRDVGDGRGSVSGSVGFSSKKDRARHEAKHNPGIPCEWRGVDGEGCCRMFSRVDNMKDHVRRIHQKSI